MNWQSFVESAKPLNSGKARCRVCNCMINCSIDEHEVLSINYLFVIFIV